MAKYSVVYRTRIQEAVMHPETGDGDTVSKYLPCKFFGGSMLRLLVQNTENTDPTIAVGWCLEPKELEIIAKEKIINPHILLVVTKVDRDARYAKDTDVEHHTEVARYVEPLERGARYVDFHQSGKHRLFATIVNGPDGNIKKLRRAYSQSRVPFLVDSDGEFLPIKPFLRKTQLDVNVASDLFADAPSAFEDWWVNLCFGFPPKDQCQFKRRRIFAYSLQPFLLLLLSIWLIVLRAIITAVLLIGGYRGINYRAMFHPWDNDLEDVWENTANDRDSIFLSQPSPNGSSKGQPRYWARPLFPYANILAFIIAWSVTGNMKQATYLLLGSLVVIYAGMGFVALVAILWPVVFGAAKSALAKIEANTTPDIDPIELEKYQFLHCDTYQSIAPGLNAVPVEQRTLRLRIEAYKAKTCRPYRVRK